MTPLDWGRLAERERLGRGGSKEADLELMGRLGFYWITAYYYWITCCSYSSLSWLKNSSLKTGMTPLSYF